MNETQQFNSAYFALEILQEFVILLSQSKMKNSATFIVSSRFDREKLKLRNIMDFYSLVSSRMADTCYSE